jgi:hypothetical protein
MEKLHYEELFTNYNPHRNIPNCHETCKGGQGLTLGCSATDDDDDDDGVSPNIIRIMK